MTVAYSNVGVAGAGTTVTGNIGYPAGTNSAGDLFVLIVSAKYPAIGETPNLGGWTSHGYVKTTGLVAGVDAGDVGLYIFTSLAVGGETGTWSTIGNPAQSSANSVYARMFRITKAAGKVFALAASVGGALNVASTSYSAAMGSDPGIIAGDLLLIATALNVDTASASAEAVSASGLTVGAVTERDDAGTSQGDDCRQVVATTLVSAGPASGVATFTATLSAAAAGATMILRIREIDAGIDAPGIASLEAIGAASLLHTIDVAGIASAGAFGTATVATAFDVGGIASLEAVGAAAVVLEVAPAGIASLEGIGIAQLDTAIDLSGISSSEAFGAVEFVGDLDPGGIPSAEAFGDLSLLITIDAPGIASGEAIGAVELDDGVFISPDGISSTESFGSPTWVTTITPTGIPSSEVFGDATAERTLAPETDYRAGVAAAYRAIVTLTPYRSAVAAAYSADDD